MDNAEVLRLAKRGVSEAQFRYGEMLLYGLDGAIQDDKEAFYWLGKAAKQGNPRALRLLGCMYIDGIAVEPDKEEGRRLLQDAQNLGDNTAADLLRVI